MSVERVYLRGDVLAEPLFNRWYAWSFLISPASSAMFVANLHLKIMQSFVASPQPLGRARARVGAAVRLERD
jgi:hypothetical protein